MSGVNSILDSNDRNELLESLLFEGICFDKDLNSYSIVLKKQLVSLSILGIYMNVFKLPEDRRTQLWNFKYDLESLNGNTISLSNNKIINFKVLGRDINSGYSMAGFNNSTEIGFYDDYVTTILQLDIKRMRNTGIWEDLDNDNISDDEKIEIVDAILKALKSIEEESISEDVESIIDDRSSAQLDCLQ